MIEYTSLKIHAAKVSIFTTTINGEHGQFKMLNVKVTALDGSVVGVDLFLRDGYQPMISADLCGIISEA
jgi:hypothetical protein